MFDALESKFKNTDQVNVICHTTGMQEMSQAKVAYMYYFLKWSLIDQMVEDALVYHWYFNQSLRSIF